MTAIAQKPASIDARTIMGAVVLKVADLDRSLRFYRDVLGFSLIDEEDSGVRIGTPGGRVLLELREDRAASPRPRGTTGLYHAAILVPTRGDLGRLLARLVEAGIPLGQSDHLVSEALYLSDPDGNGLELYRDRPRDEWSWKGGRVAMSVDPLDLRSLLDEGRRGDWIGLPEGTVMGHVHLNVADLQEAEAFYHGILGFDIVASLPGALFVSAGGYHHHLGLNTWESRGGGPAPEKSVGLERFTILLPEEAAVAECRVRCEAAGLSIEEATAGFDILDPWRNRVRITTEA